MAQIPSSPTKLAITANNNQSIAISVAPKDPATGDVIDLTGFDEVELNIQADNSLNVQDIQLTTPGILSADETGMKVSVPAATLQLAQQTFGQVPFLWALSVGDGTDYLLAGTGSMKIQDAVQASNPSG